MKVLDLFSGIGGFSLGLERAGMETVAFCEIDPYCQKVLKKHWPHVPIYDDVRELTRQRLESDGITGIDVITGGFPCQPFSSAARGRNPKDTLSLEFVRVISEVGADYVVAENVKPKAFSQHFVHRIRELGYEIYPTRISANDVGADHKRDRWWLCAYPHNKSELPGAINAEVACVPKIQSGLWGAENYARAVRVFDGIPHRMDRIRALGNAVVPQIPEIIGRAIMQCTPT